MTIRYLLIELLFSCVPLFALESSILHDYYRSDTCQPSIEFKSKKSHLPGVIKYEFSFHSLCWPDRDSMWQHRLNVYVPEESSSDQGILLVQGGINHFPDYVNNKVDIYDHPVIALGLSQMAHTTSAVVIELKDIPNQYISIEPGQPLKEDYLLSVTWLKALMGGDPFWPAQLPMAKATSLAIDALETIAPEYGFMVPEKYLISGLSKRGWSAWLTALEDERMNAILPGVIGILDTENTLIHIKNSLGNWPDPFYPYVKDGVAGLVGTDCFKQLMKTVDPWTYRHIDGYQGRFDIPTFHLTSSGDDFFVPDSQNHLLADLTGTNYFRVLPNDTHYIDLRPYMDSTIAFYKALTGEFKLPEISWTQESNHLLRVTSNEKPVTVTLWTANNPENRDFRYRKGITYTPKNLEANCDEVACYIEVPNLALESKGYTAQFVELQFPNYITLTTPVFIYPDDHPNQ